MGHCLGAIWMISRKKYTVYLFLEHNVSTSSDLFKKLKRRKRRDMKECPEASGTRPEA